MTSERDKIAAEEYCKPRFHPASTIARRMVAEAFLAGCAHKESEIAALREALTKITLPWISCIQSDPKSNCNHIAREALLFPEGEK